MKPARIAVALWLLAACGASPAPPPAALPTTAEPRAPATTDSGQGTSAAPAPEKLAADSPRTTSGGTVFVGPTGWTVTTKGTATILEPPEADSHLALVNVNGGDAATAVAAAWSIYRPEAKRTLKLVTPRPARNGWDELQAFDYETSPNERAVVFASARRHGDTWTVVIVDATKATFDKRIGQVLLVRDTLRPKGYSPESFGGKKANPLDPGRIKAIGEFVEVARKELAIPGVALALIDGGKVVFEGGFGVRELGKVGAVDSETNFIIASNTKGMTTLLLAKLVDEGKLGWDIPVVQVMPSFKLGDADTTNRVLVKHLVCACTGLPRQDLEWKFEFKQATPKSSMQQLATMQPTSQFGEVYQYSNQLAAAGGYVAAHVVYPNKELGAGYDDAMRTKVFEPLGMKGTTFEFARAERGNHASPHETDIDGAPRVANMDLNHAVTPIRPTVGAWSSVHDVATYVQMELAKGLLPDGTRLVSEANVLARRAPQVRIGEKATYGMGFVVERNWDVQVVSHAGSIFGYKSELMFLPDYGVGAIMLANSDDARAAFQPFIRRMLEILFDGHPEAFEDLALAAKQMRDYRAKTRERLVVPADREAVVRLAARYTSATLGELKVRKAGAGTVFDFGEWSTAVASRKNDDGSTSFVPIEHGTDVDFEFVMGERGGRRVLVVRDAQHEYVFTEA
jgi:CubicO group peptidase (beta-lactamase class C family)